MKTLIQPAWPDFPGPAHFSEGLSLCSISCLLQEAPPRVLEGKGESIPRLEIQKRLKDVIFLVIQKPNW